MSTLTAQETSNNIFSALDMIVENKLNKAQFDKTYLCKIIEAKEEKKNDNSIIYQYTLEYEEGGKTFLLYQSQKYLKNTYVWVKIPQNNWDSEGKEITGKYEKNDNTTSSFLNYDNGMIKADKQTLSTEGSLELKGESSYIQLGSITFNSITAFDELYTTLGLKASFQIVDKNEKNQENNEITSGSYGIFITEENGEPVKNNILAFLDSSEFLGNPYNIKETYFPFSILINKLLNTNNSSISYLSGKTVYIYLYQDGKFKINDKELAIKVKNIEVSLGYLTSELSKEAGIKLYVKNGSQDKKYSSKDYKYTIGFYFFKNDGNFLKVYQDTIPEEYNIEWYRYKIGSTIDIGGGVYYGKIDNGLNKTLSIDGTQKTITINENEEKYKVNLPDINITQENFKLVIKKGKDDKYSDSITLINADKEEITTDIEQGISLSLSLSNKQQINNLATIYGNDNQLMSSVSYVTTNAVSLRDDINLQEEEIIWEIPNNSTLLEPFYKEVTKKENYNTDGKINTDRLLIKNGEIYKPIAKGSDYNDKATYAVTNYSFPSEVIFNSPTQVRGVGLIQLQIYLKRTYIPAAANNLIKCSCQKHNIYGTKILRVGTYGTSGTGFSFNAYFEEGWAISPGETKTVLIELSKDGENLNDTIDVYKKGETKSSILFLDWINLETNKSTKIETNNLTQPEEDKKKIYFTLTCDGKFLTNPQYQVLKITLKGYPIENGKNIDLTTYLQVPVIDEAYQNSYVSGPVRVVYNQMGNAPSGSKDYFSISEIDKYFVHYIGWDSDVGINKKLKPESDNYNYSLYYPELFNINLMKKSLRIKFCEKDDETSEGKIYCIYPILFLQNTYESSVLNAWDGEKTITNEGYILSQLIGAGSKDSGNNYTGVFMGTVGKEISDASTGIYGFNKGAKTFEINAENGNAYFNGEIKATKGEIAGWIIKENSFESAGKVCGMRATSGSDNAFWAGYKEGSDPTFKVTGEGDIYSSGNVKISGNIQILGNGKIGDCTLENGHLEVDAANIKGQLKAGQITAEGLNISNATFRNITVTGNSTFLGTISGGSIIQNGSFFGNAGGISGAKVIQQSAGMYIQHNNANATFQILNDSCSLATSSGYIACSDRVIDLDGRTIYQGIFLRGNVYHSADGAHWTKIY